MRTVEGHPDFARLEERLAERIGEAKAASPAGPFAPILIVVPTARFRSYLHAWLGRRFGALLNVEILEHSSAAREAAAAAGADLPRTLPRRVLEALLESCLDRASPRLAAYVRDCPGAIASLSGTMRELRESGVEPGSWKNIEGITARGREILDLYRAWCERIGVSNVTLNLRSATPWPQDAAGVKEASSAAPLTHSDRAGQIREAAKHAGAWARRFEMVIHYGAYELIGSNLDLMRAIEEGGTPVVYLVPWHPTAPAYAYARKFLTEFLADEPRLLQARQGGGGTPRGRHGADRLPEGRIHDEAPPPSPPPDPRLLEANGDTATGGKGAGRLPGDQLAFLYDEGLPSPRLERRMIDARAGGGTASRGEGADRLLGDRLPFLYDEDSPPPPPLDSPTLSFFHAQGAEAELRETALRILDLVRGGRAGAADGEDSRLGVGASNPREHQRDEDIGAGDADGPSTGTSPGDAKSSAGGPSTGAPLCDSGANRGASPGDADVIAGAWPGDADVSTGARQGEAVASAAPPGDARTNACASPLSRIAIIARSLEPVAPLLGPILHGRFGIPFTTSAAFDAAADPQVMAALNLARVVLDDCERQPLLDLARSGLLLPESGVDPADEADEWDRLARKYRIMRGRDAWTRELQLLVSKADLLVSPDADEETRGRAERRREARLISVERLGRWLDSLDTAAAPLRQAGSWAAWADSLSDLLSKRLAGFMDTLRREIAPGAQAVRSALAEMREMGEAGIAFPQGDDPARSAAALRFLEAGIGRSRIPIGSIPRAGAGERADNAGVRVLDAMQARGLAFDHVFLIGFNADMFPRRPREDPFLGEPDRALLRAGLSRPLPLRAAGREEEHLLLAHLLGAARRGLTISWQRADETGRARVESLALREVARVALGGPELARATDPARAHRVAAHPADSATEIRDRFGMMPVEEAGVGALLQLASPAGALQHRRSLAGDGLIEEGGNLLHGLEMLAAIESFAPAHPRFDAIVGARAAPPPESWSPTRLEDLGNCPQQYFFRHHLRVNELDAVLEDHEVDIREMGILAHRVLQSLYPRLTAEGHLTGAPGDASGAARRGVELLEQEWTAHFFEVAAVINRRFPLMWKSLSALWKNALRTFLLHDLSELERAGSKILALEERVEKTLDVGGARPLPIRGRIDRIVLEAAGGRIVADYKTMGNLPNRVDISRILKGRSLQLPLYVLMQESAAASKEGTPSIRAEVIGVGPAFSEGASPSEPSPEGYPSREILDADLMARIREGLLETLHVLDETAAAGCFPLNADSDRCGWCPYRRACRRGHAPTLTRLASTPGVARYLELGLKSSRLPLLAARAREGEMPR